jgi:hypothetical protein
LTEGLQHQSKAKQPTPLTKGKFTKMIYKNGAYFKNEKKIQLMEYVCI